jgi:outer membrane protein assembly factor BamB
MFGYGPEHTSFNPTESAISVGNVAGLVQRYPPSDGNGCGIGTVDLVVPELCSSPAVAKGSVYFGTASGDLVASDAGTGSLQWSGHTGGAISSSPAVVDGVVYVGSDDFRLYAFDAAGTTNCSGSPKRCAPLWTANFMDEVRSSPTVANGVVYVAISGGVLAFSASGTTNCSGSPKVCSPLWATALANSAVRTPAIADGVLYVTGDYLYAYDASGTINCSGTPKFCAPLWTGKPGSGTMQTPPAVANGVVYVGAQTYGGPPLLEAFSAAGITNCSGSPKVCNPLWAGIIPGGGSSPTTMPAIANGVVYISSGQIGNSQESLLAAFDAAGMKNCSPTFGQTCTPLWTVEHRLDDLWASWSPAVANGVVYVTYQAIDFFSGYAGIQAFDATGTINCSGTPKTCSPLWSDIVAPPIGGGLAEVSSPVVANGAVYLNAGAIHKYALPS